MRMPKIKVLTNEFKQKLAWEGILEFSEILDLSVIVT